MGGHKTGEGKRNEVRRAEICNRLAGRADTRTTDCALEPPRARIRAGFLSRQDPQYHCRQCGTLRLGGLAAGGSDTDLTLITRDVFKLNIQLIRGYKGTQELNLAIQRGEVEGRGIGVSSLANTMTDWYREGKLRMLVQFGHATR